ncbi:MAG: hypothetical protein Q8P57_04035 [Candidatus Pacearchaeota archaeon]|nr:hypothetical protein [Candidatus Pacearchaeota archaeon]
MAFNFEALIWYIFLIDSIGANILSLFFHKWYKKNCKGFYKHFPSAKGWSLFYLFLVLWIGWLLIQLGVLPW